MLIDGTAVNDKVSQASLTCSQLIVSNYRPSSSDLEEKIHYHAKKRETPLTLYNGLELYGKFRCKNIITHQFHLGLSVPYLRILGITKQISETMLKMFERYGCFIPRSTRKGVFTVIPKDNIDLNSRPYTAKGHYHGTSLSLLQFRETKDQGIPYEFDFQFNGKFDSLKIDSLPEKYSEIKVFIPDMPEYYAPKRPDSSPVPDLNSPLLKEALAVEYSWLDRSVRGNHAWASFHASLKQYRKREIDFTAILPLLRQVVHTLSMQYHCMTIVTDMIKEVNPGQTPVDVCDQPIFALTKQLMWRYPDKFKRYFTLFGGLHIEKALLVMHGELIQRSGLDKLLNIRNLSVTSLQNTVSSVTDIKGARYGLQVAACAIYQKLVGAHLLSESPLPLFEWLTERSNVSVMTLYWKLLLEM